MSKLFERLKSIKNLDLIICFVAIAVIVAILFFDGFSIETNGTSFSAYVNQMENKVEKALLSIDGVKSVDLVINFENGVEQVYAYETTTKTVGDTTTVNTEIVTSGGAPVLIKELAPKVSSVAVVIKGNNGAVLEYKARQLLSTLLQIDADKISVVVYN